MNSIEKMIHELCPEGVKCVRLGEVCEINRGVRVVKKDLMTEGKIPVYQNSMIPLGFCKEGNQKPGTTFVIGAGSAGEVGYSEEEFWAADDCYCIKTSDCISDKYVYYCLMNKQVLIKSRVRKASVPRLSRESLASILIPLPPPPHPGADSGHPGQVHLAGGGAGLPQAAV